MDGKTENTQEQCPFCGQMVTATESYSQGEFFIEYNCNCVMSHQIFVIDIDDASDETNKL